MKQTIEELLKLPSRDWADTEKEYSEILIVPSGEMHDSGFMCIAIIGKIYGSENYEICGFPDDISCFFPHKKYGDKEEYEIARVRMDCYPNGALRYHGIGKFKVSEAISSMEIHFYHNS